MNQSRQKYLDSLRGIAASIVVFTHYFAAFYPYSIFGNQDSYQQHNAWETLLHTTPIGLVTAGYFAVCLFFILSGYVLSYGFLGVADCKIKILAAIVKRPIRLGGLVFFTIIVASILWSNGLLYNKSVSVLSNSQPWFSHFWQSDFSLKDLFHDLGFSLFGSSNKYNPPLWTIDIELYGSILVFLYVLFFGNVKYRFLLLLVLFFLFSGHIFQGFILGMIAADIHKNYRFGYFPKMGKPLAMVSFFVGIFLASYPYYLDARLAKESIYWFLPNFTILGGGYPMLGAFLLFVSINSIDKIKNILEAPILQFLGKVSYSLYAVHFLILGSFSSWLFLLLQNYISYEASFVLIFICSWPIIIFLAFLMTKYVDEPAVQLSSRLGKFTVAVLESIADHSLIRNTVRILKYRII